MNKGRDGEQEREFKDYYQCEWTTTPINGTTNSKKPVCGSVTFRNLGTATLMIDNLNPIFPGQSFTYEMYPNELNIHSYTISWQGTGTKSGIMICKEYSK